VMVSKGGTGGSDKLRERRELAGGTTTRRTQDVRPRGNGDSTDGRARIVAGSRSSSRDGLAQTALEARETYRVSTKGRGIRYDIDEPETLTAACVYTTPV
jgi:hypothetical protein